MARARIRTDRRGRSARRPVEWLRGRTVGVIVAGSVGAITAAAFDLTSLFAKFSDYTSPTIVRVRGELTLAAVLTTGGILPWSAGMVKMSLKAATLGILAIPVPGVDDADWMWYAGGSMGDGGTTALQPQEDVQNIMVDTKAMRKFQQDDDTLVFVFANLGGLASHDFNVGLNFSILVKE